MIVLVIVLSALWTVRAQRRISLQDTDAADARLYAQAGLELGLHVVDTDPNWRTNVGGWLLDRPLGEGRYDVRFTDPTDGDLTDSLEDTAVITSIGYKGSARHKLQVTLITQYDPLEALRCAMHCAGELKINSGGYLAAMSGPMSTNGNLRLDGVADGNAQAASVSGGGSITGILTVPADSKDMPASEVTQSYKSIASTIYYYGDKLERTVLSPGSSPYGPGNADGVYYWNTGDCDVTIRNLRVLGTLIVDVGGKKAIVEEAVLMEPYRKDYPALIIVGKAEIRIKSREKRLYEISNGTNFNPSGTSYGGWYDWDILDSYPNAIYGLVHVTGVLKLSESATINGAVICENAVEVAGYNTINYDSKLYSNPPVGYSVSRTHLAEGSFRRTTD